MARRPSGARIRKHFSYTVEEAAEALGVTPQTVRRWITEDGLAALTAKRPALILGYVLKDFLAIRSNRRKHPLGAGQVFCLRCKSPEIPAGRMAEYRPRTATSGQLLGLCPRCETLCFRAVSRAGLSDHAQILEIEIRDAPQA